MTTIDPDPETSTPSVTVTEPVQPLDYRHPEPRVPSAVSIRDTLLGVVISLLLGLGAGAISFGVMVTARFREELATVIACGITAVTLALCLLGLLLWLRGVRR